MAMKRCTYCKKKKSSVSFNVRRYKSGKTGRRSYCKKCGNVAAIRWRKNNPELTSVWDRNKRYKKLYGITEEKYQEKLKEQNGRCAICRKHSSEFKSRLHVDHSHKSGFNRGLLCIKCNTALGSLNRKITLISAIRYLEKYGE